MKWAVVYFSGTGNTEYIAKLFKNELDKKGYEIELVDITKTKKFNDNYNFLIFGSPIHAEVFPIVFTEWIDNNIKVGNNRKCIIFSTQGANKAAGANILAQQLKNKGFNISVVEYISMPNNYYLVGFGKSSREEIEKLKFDAGGKVHKIVDDFLRGKDVIGKVSNTRMYYAKISYNLFLKYSKSWARKKVGVDLNLCVKCMKCVNDCPTKNIYLDENIKFKNKCISCQRCVHCCPVNAFTYKGKHFEQYKL